MLNIKQRQKNLNFLNYDTGGIDGKEGAKTKRAYYCFQRDFNLSMLDGIYGNETDTRLIQVIKDIQIRLACNLIDGLVGNETIQKCKEFQKAHGLVVDGICGVKTRNVMNDEGVTWEGITHFTKKEFTCKCGCGYNPIDVKLVHVLETIRSHFGGKPVMITSGCRCTTYNRKVGGVEGSKHVLGRAADFYINGVTTATLLQYCQSLVKQGKLGYTYTNNTNMRGAVHINL